MATALEMITEKQTVPLEEYRAHRAQHLAALETHAPDLEHAVRRFGHMSSARREHYGREVAKAIYAVAKAELQLNRALTAAMKAEIAEEEPGAPETTDAATH